MRTLADRDVVGVDDASSSQSSFCSLLPLRSSRALLVRLADAGFNGRVRLAHFTWYYGTGWPTPTDCAALGAVWRTHPATLAKYAVFFFVRRRYVCYTPRLACVQNPSESSQRGAVVGVGARRGQRQIVEAGSTGVDHRRDERTDGASGGRIAAEADTLITIQKSTNRNTPRGSSIVSASMPPPPPVTQCISRSTPPRKATIVDDGSPTTSPSIDGRSASALSRRQSSVVHNGPNRHVSSQAAVLALPSATSSILLTHTILLGAHYRTCGASARTGPYRNAARRASRSGR